jgi:ABC-2 type transport system permease protein
MLTPNVWRMARQELKAYFVSPIGYVVLSLFSVLEGWFFFNHVNRFNDVVSTALLSRRAETLNQINLQRFVMEPLFKEIFMLLMVFLPAITMRLVAEEKKQKTMELLLTSPLRTSEIILGKYLSVLAFLGLMLGLTLIHPTILFVFGRPGPDLLPIVTGYGGVFMAGACILSVGLFASCLTENQIVAFVWTVFLCQLFAMISWPAPVIGGTAGDILRALSLKDHTLRMARAFVDTRGLVYLTSFTFLWLFLSHRVIEGSRVR